MPLPSREPTSPFDITRASHVVLDAADLAASRRFYEELIGLVVTEAGDDVVYLRGVEEACHHSLVLRRAAEGACNRIGFRVRREADLDAAATWFAHRSLPAGFADEFPAASVLISGGRRLPPLHGLVSTDVEVGS